MNETFKKKVINKNKNKNIGITPAVRRTNAPFALSVKLPWQYLVSWSLSCNATAFKDILDYCVLPNLWQ